jgi:hypothetical protein
MLFPRHRSENARSISEENKRSPDGVLQLPSSYYSRLIASTATSYCRQKIENSVP